MDIAKYVIFHNENLVVVDKPSGSLSVYSRLGKNDPRPCLSSLLEEQLNIRIFPVHRLDFEVSGILVYAKNTITQRVWNQLFEKHEIQKTYEALTELSINPPELLKEQSWISHLVRGKKRTYEAAFGQWSKTLATPRKIINFGDGKKLIWQLSPVTGRSHQLRYHLFSHGFPIVGDALYSAKTIFKENAIGLRAVSLQLLNQDKLKDLGVTPEELKEKLFVKSIFD
jgi:tRNA pseudouridine32 synthase/23S rRNA pseudouridine746 synthase